MTIKDSTLSTEGMSKRGKTRDGQTSRDGRIPLLCFEDQGVSETEVIVMDVKQVSSAFQVQAYETVAKSGKKTAQTKSQVMGQEQVELSESSLNMQKVKEAVDAAPDVRIPIVEEIQKRIANNDYPIPTHAEKALDVMLKNRIL
jgi:anti-sigma28 factor (negative regulator of flagellin synthesis)